MTKARVTVLKFYLKAWCSYCHRFRSAHSGPDPLVEGRVTEILDKHRSRSLLTRCPGSGQDADPVM